MKGYKKHIEYHFEVEGEMIAITSWGEGYVYLEELRKNGQEDTHMAGVIIKNSDGLYSWEDDDFNLFVRYHSQELADGILNYVRNNGIPEKEIENESE